MDLEMEQIYDTLMGYCTSDHAAREVENGFAEGSICDRLYAQVYESKLRLNQRLGTQEDTDVEIIIRNLLEITKIISCQMYVYGRKTGSQSDGVAE